MTFRWRLIGLLLCVLVVSPTLQADDPIEIPILLRKHCVTCHGEDAAEADLRLDSLAHIRSGGHSGAIVNETSPDKSLLLERLKSDRDDVRMPPDTKPLQPEEIQAIENWIRSGMAWSTDHTDQAWQSHWSYQPLRRPAVPATRNSQWPCNPIDSFVLAKLESENYEPAPLADSRTLRRRLYATVVGLPPSSDLCESNLIEELTKPSASISDTQYAELVERLLASPQFGERWARHWLDVVRFAESDGFEMNQHRPNAWHYRDYVITSINRDTPFQQFVREQIAGDQLGADVATGFLVGGSWDRVKSPDPVLTANQRADELHDMVSTMGSAFLGLTVGCARCHSHKFDPIPQHDYYAIKACLAGVQHGERPIRSTDEIARQQRVESLRSELRELNNQLNQHETPAGLQPIVVIDDSSPGFTSLREPTGVVSHASGRRRGELQQSPDEFGLADLGFNYRWWQASADEPIASYAPKLDGQYRVWISWGAGFETHSRDATYVIDADGELSTLDDQQLVAQIDQRWFDDQVPAELAGRPMWSGFRNCGVHSLSTASRLLLKCGKSNAAITADAVLFERVGSVADSRYPHVRSKVTSALNTERVEPTTLLRLRFAIHKTSDAEPCIDELVCIDMFGNNVAPQAELVSSGDFSGNEFHKRKHLTDGRVGNEFSWIATTSKDAWVELRFPNPVTLQRIEWSRDGSPEPKYRDRVAIEYTISASMDGESWTPIASHVDRLAYDYVHPVPPYRLFATERVAETSQDKSQPHGIAELMLRRSKLEEELAAMTASKVAYAGRFVTPEPVFRLHRGDPTQNRDRVAPGGLQHIPPKWSLDDSVDEPQRRLALAQWIASNENPLTARVIVNRLWSYHFGSGIVETPSDFGINGVRPTHPELLDWLASELIEHDWSLKHIHRLILNSSTYRQSSEHNATPDRLWGRYRLRRLEAEAIRDSLLSIAGTLKLETGGPGFDLFEPNTNYVKVYDSKLAPGPDTFRRMVYQSKPRMQLDNVFGTFDCPDAGQVAPKRSRSVNPLQALSMLNSPFTIDQSRWLAKRLQAYSTDITEQVRYAFSLAYARPPEPEELKLAVEFIGEFGLEAFARALWNTSEWMTIE